MGEFVGIDPSRAHDLIRRLEAGSLLLGGVRPLVDAAVAEAGDDWAGPPPRATALRRAQEFLHDARRELRWRIDAAEQLVPVRERGLLTAVFPFACEAEATRAAAETATAVLAALATGRPDEVERAFAAITGGEATNGAPGEAASATPREAVGDPAYAAALLGALGPGGLVLVLRGWSEVEVPGERDGLPPAALVRAASASPGLLARAFAAAERTGRLGEEWRELPATAPADVLTTLIALARPSGAFLNVVAVELLNRRPDAGPDWNLHHLAHAYRSFPEALQELLAEHQKETGVLLDAYALGTHPAYERALAAALRHALEPGAGADGLRERAWSGLTGALDAGHRLWQDLETFREAGERV
ncbi:hypothetical protein ACBR40_16740 [Nonomuraea sp. AD125B]|uniref:hypothetical protein n=1 Tax=Nonomuraea sp. AD125B TaxID=3242897 RepID=UPI003527CBE7